MTKSLVWVPSNRATVRRGFHIRHATFNLSLLPPPLLLSFNSTDKVAGDAYVHIFQCTSEEKATENVSRREAKRPLNADRQGRGRLKVKRAKKSS